MSYIMNSKFIILRLTNECDKGVIKNLLSDSLKSTFEHLPLLDIGEVLVVGDAIVLPSVKHFHPVVIDNGQFTGIGFADPDNRSTARERQH